MTRHRRSIQLFILVPLAVAIGSWASATERTHRAANRSSTGKNQAAPSALPAPAAAPTTSAPVLTAGTAGASAPLYKLDWYSINGGGAIDASSASYKAGLSVGQSVAGEANSPSYKMGIGFWYGAGGCNCPKQGDLAPFPAGNNVIDVNDVLYIIRVAFSNGTDIQDPECPKSRGEVNLDGVVNVNDVLYLIKTAFSNGPNPLNPCAP